MNRAAPLRNAAQAIQWLDEQGMSQAEVARRFGVAPPLVYAILAGKKPCRRGASHNIAVFLGLKRGVATAKPQTWASGPLARRAGAERQGAAA
ncbi:MAG TPA: DNA-binding protein [Burkholderiaceae bacterium]|nr:DNA-binding protein [Burkholderiaceae bacterium]